MKTSQRSFKAILAAAAAATVMGGSAFAADKKAASQQTQPAQSQEPSLEGSVVNVDQIKEKYWARGDESEMGVVQNRAYSKKGRFELGVIGGAITSDPFLNTSSVGGTFGYHFSEYVSFHLIGFKDFASPSSALTSFRQNTGGDANTNLPLAYYGGEVNGSIIYGKLSVFGKSIIYYDLHLIGGMGLTSTESGTYFTPHVGIGQRFFLSKYSSLRIDYRLMEYNETLLQKVITSQLGTPIGTRINWTNSINIGVNFFFEVFKK